MIDEYQDFSQLYFDLIEAIQKYNQKLKIVCVGDDWQLINSFA
jgi:DNA helicase-4